MPVEEGGRIVWIFSSGIRHPASRIAAPQPAVPGPAPVDDRGPRLGWALAIGLPPAACLLAIVAAILSGAAYPIATLIVTAVAIVAGFRVREARLLRGSAERFLVVASTLLSLLLFIVTACDVLDLALAPLGDAETGWVVAAPVAALWLLDAGRRDLAQVPHGAAWLSIFVTILLAVTAQTLVDAFGFDVFGIAATALQGGVASWLVLLACAGIALRYARRNAFPLSARLILAGAAIMVMLTVGSELQANHPVAALTLWTAAAVVVLATLRNRVGRRSWVTHGPAAVAVLTPVLLFVFGDDMDDPYRRLAIGALILLIVALHVRCTCTDGARGLRVLVPTRYQLQWSLAVVILGAHVLLIDMVSSNLTRNAPAASILVELEDAGVWRFSEAQVAAALMRDQYLWRDQVGEPVDEEDDAHSVLAAMRVPRDRWSTSRDADDYGRELKGERRGLGLYVRPADSGEAIVYVLPGSPADVAGLRRGMRLESIDGQPGLVSSAQDAASAGVPPAVARAVYVDERGERREVSIREEALHAGPVLETRVLATAEGPVGYLLLDRFDLEGANTVGAAFSQFREAGVTELVVDLRYNPGGAIRASATLASLIAGPVHAGKPYVALRHNARHSDRDTRRFLLTGETKALGLSRVFVITSAHTCSASELLINGLRPHLEVVTVGSTTCGKPYGFSGVLHRDTVYTVVSFEAVNAAGEGGYTDGLAAHCPALDDLGHALGAPEEDSLRTALAYIATGACAREPLAQSPAGTALP